MAIALGLRVVNWDRSFIEDALVEAIQESS